MPYHNESFSSYRFWYVSIVSCRLNRQNCRWEHVEADFTVSYDLWLVNGNPLVDNHNPFKYQYSCDTQVSQWLHFCAQALKLQSRFLLPGSFPRVPVAVVHLLRAAAAPVLRARAPAPPRGQAAAVRARVGVHRAAADQRAPRALRHQRRRGAIHQHRGGHSGNILTGWKVK